ncbi:MAG TPA: PIG-L family deacetylase [Opitutaceae bacterium]
MRGRALQSAALGSLLALAALRLGAAGAPTDPRALEGELRSFRECGSVLYVAAHPDDENTQLIAYLARGRDYRTAYLSLTRGDGGQNALGPEFGDLLGVIRTQELLAARRVDGGEQFFSRARDFGYSKDYRQTLAKWDRQQVLSDVVRVIRTFQPDIVITRFPPEPIHTHGHHTASAVLALEAFRLAGDPKAFPEQLGDGLRPWQPRRILWNSFGTAFGGPADVGEGVVRMPIDGTDPVTGASFAVLAAKSRSMHQTQGFANFSVASRGRGPDVESFRLLAGEPAKGDIMDGVDTTWGRVPGGSAIGALSGAALDHFDGKDPSASVPALLEIHARLAALADGPFVARKRVLLDRIIAGCLGLSAETTLAPGAGGSGDVVPGDSVSVRSSAVVASAYPVTWKSVRYATLAGRRQVDVGAALRRGEPRVEESHARVRKDMPLTEPYWLREDETPGMFRVDDASLIGRPEYPPAFPARFEFSVGGQQVFVDTQAVAPGTRQSPFVIPPVFLHFTLGVQVFAPGSAHAVALEVRAARAGARGSVALRLPPGWASSPAAAHFDLKSAGDMAPFTFTVTAPAAPERTDIGATARVAGADYGTDRILISYPHIPRQLLQPRARVKAVCADVRVTARHVGYIPGAGDSTVAALEQMGCEVRVLKDEDLTAQGLSGLDAVVIGIRAFGTTPALAARMPALTAFAQAGGTVVEQYETPGGIQSLQIAPYPLSISRDLPTYRVTNENSAVAFLEPDSPALNTPNKIGPADFEGWTQERGLDFASKWDGRFTPVIACSDPGEAPLKGGLLVARVGRGYFVYTGLSFFRQLPAGVPGAYRLFANLISLGR